MQQYNKDKALYEQLHAQGRLPSQTQAKPVVTVQPLETTPQPIDFDVPSFDTGNSVPAATGPQSVVVQPVLVAPALPALDAGTPVFDAPVANLENTIPFQGGKTTITNPEATRGPVKFTIDGTAVTLQPGMEITYDSKATYLIEFTRGGGQGKNRYTLGAGTNYNFSVSAKGWELMSAEAVAEPENEIPNLLPNTGNPQASNPLLDLPSSNTIASDELSAKIMEYQRNLPTPNQSTGQPQVPNFQPEFTRGSKIFITNPDAQLYDGAKALTTPKLFQQTFTVLDVNATQVQIEHAGKKGWIKKSDGILSLANEF